MKRIKRYKALPPEETVDNISGILFDRLGVELRITEYAQQNNLFFSARVDVETRDFKGFRIGTNGKGLTRDFSLASAYAELMERIQNGLLFHHRYYTTEKFVNGYNNKEYTKLLKDEDVLLKYAFAPDEKFITDENEIEILINKYVKSFNNEDIIADVLKNGITLLPFYNVKDKQVEMLPITVIHNSIGSNGMCAGNNPKEAIIQGLSEIIERYVLRLIYQNNLSLPSIPREDFKGNDIYERIIELEKENNITIDIKDCSCGYGIPAVGVLITANGTNKYQFRIGVDPSPVTALERSLTELFQGRSSLHLFDMNIGYQHKLLNDSVLKEKEFRFSFLAGVGQYPISMFYKKHSYKYEGFDSRLSSSDDYDLSYMINTIHNLGFNIYIRDVSFLGFPSYRIYIPGMSELNNIFSNTHFKQTYNKNSSLRIFLIAHNLYEAKKEDIKALLQSIDELPELLDTTAISSLNKKDPWSNTNIYFLAALLCFRYGEVSRAVDYMHKAFKLNANDKTKLLYQCCEDMMHTGDNSSAYDILKSMYGEQLFKLAYNLLYSPQWLSHFNFTSCFNCSKCKIKDSCFIIPYAKLLKRIENQYELNLPIQNRLQEIFS